MAPGERTVDSLSAVVVTLVGSCAVVALESSWSMISYIGLLALSVVAWTRVPRILWTLAKWCVPFAVPVVLIHGILNPGFPPRFWLVDVVPIRPEGMIYGIAIANQLTLFAVVAAYWTRTNRDDLVDDLMRCGLPIWLILLCSHSIAVMGVIERRISNVYLAQQARGINVGPSVWTRIRAFPSVIVPTVVGTLIEEEGRIPALVSRGFGCNKPTPPSPQLLSGAQRVWRTFPAILLAIVFVTEKMTLYAQN